MKIRSTILAFGVVALACTSLSAQSNWPQFRGKTGGPSYPAYANV